MKKRPAKAWLPIILIMITLGIIAIFSVIIDVQISPTISFVCGTIIAALAFHFFSVGNTVYSVSASLRNEELADYAYDITTGAIIISLGGGILFIMGLILLLFMNHVTGLKLFLLQILVLLGNTCGVFLFLYGLLKESKISRWYLKLYSIIRERNSSTQNEKEQ